MGQLRDDERGFSEANGVAILIGMTVLVTATVGLNVLVVGEEDTGPPQANFSYDYIETNGVLVITHERGDEFPAGQLRIEGPNTGVTWAEVSGKNATATVGPGDIAQISEGNAYGERVGRAKPIHIYYTGGTNRTQLSRWPQE